MITKPFIVLAAVLVLAGGGFFTYKKTHTPKIEVASESTETPTNTPTGKKIPFSELLKQGGSYQCTVHQSVQGIESVGTVFIDKNRIRGYFTTQTEGMNIQSSLIVKDGYTYTWSSALGNRGMKIPNERPYGGTQKEDQTTQASAQYGFNGETIGDYDCDAWTVDESKFMQPTSIVFRELLVQ